MFRNLYRGEIYRKVYINNNMGGGGRGCIEVYIGYIFL